MTITTGKRESLFLPKHLQTVDNPFLHTPWPDALLPPPPFSDRQKLYVSNFIHFFIIIIKIHFYLYLMHNFIKREVYNINDVGKQFYQARAKFTRQCNVLMVFPWTSAYSRHHSKPRDFILILEVCSGENAHGIIDMWSKN